MTLSIEYSTRGYAITCQLRPKGSRPLRAQLSVIYDGQEQPLEEIWKLDLIKQSVNYDSAAASVDAPSGRVSEQQLKSMLSRFFEQNAESMTDSEDARRLLEDITAQEHVSGGLRNLKASLKYTEYSAVIEIRESDTLLSSILFEFDEFTHSYPRVETKGKWVVQVLEFDD